MASTNMYGIYIRSRKEPIFVDDERGEKLRTAYLEGKLPCRLSIGDWTGDAELIKSIQKNDAPDPEDSSFRVLDGRMNDSQEYNRKIDEEYYRDRQDRMRLPIEQRAKNMRIPGFIWQAHTGDVHIPEYMRTQIEERQAAYLRENPTLSYANPICYRDLMPDQKSPRSIWHVALMRMASNHIATDKNYAK